MKRILRPTFVARQKILPVLRRLSSCFVIFGKLRSSLELQQNVNTEGD